MVKIGIISINRLLKSITVENFVVSKENIKYEELIGVDEFPIHTKNSSEQHSKSTSLIPNSMSIKSKTDWIKGYLDSLEYSESISKKQISVLKEKFNELYDEIEEYMDLPFDENDADCVKEEKRVNNITNKNSDDDLPF